MKTGNLLKRWTAALLALLLTVVLFAIPAFADDDTTEVTTADEEVTTEAATEEETAGSDADEETEETEEKKGLSTQSIITLCVFGVLIVAAVVLGIIFREKVGKFLRVYKSEAKKIVWLPWDQTKKSTLVVLVVLVLCALAICLLDFALGQGYLAFLKLF